MYLFQSGQMYEGQWRAGSKHGWSIFSLHNGQQWPGAPRRLVPASLHPPHCQVLQRQVPGARCSRVL